MLTLIKVLSGERRRLKKLVAVGQKKLVGITRELATLKRHLAALDMFESARKGKTTRSRQRRRSRGPSRRPRILAALKSSSNGITRGEILEKLHAKGNKSAEQSITNALSNLKKAGQITSKRLATTLSRDAWPLGGQTFVTGSEAENCVAHPRRSSPDRIAAAQSPDPASPAKHPPPELADRPGAAVRSRPEPPGPKLSQPRRLLPSRCGHGPSPG